MPIGTVMMMQNNPSQKRISPPLFDKDTATGTRDCNKTFGRYGGIRVFGILCNMNPNSFKKSTTGNNTTVLDIIQIMKAITVHGIYKS